MNLWFKDSRASPGPPPRNSAHRAVRMIAMLRQRMMAVALAALAVSPAVWAQSAPPAAKPEAPAQAAPATPATPDPLDAERKKFADAIKDAVKVDGQFTFYTRKKDIFLELPESRLGQLFCLQATLSTGAGSNLQAGDPLNQDAIEVFRFERVDDSIRVIKPNLAHRWPADHPLALASSRSFPEAVLGDYTIVARNPDTKSVLINLNRLFDGQLVELPQAIESAFGPGFNLDSNLSRPLSVKSFPENATVRMALNYRRMSRGDSGLAALLAALTGASAASPLADGRSLPLEVSFTLWFRPNNGYRPRLADPRVGYFTTDFFDLNKFNAVDRTTKYIQRFQLEKKQPFAPVSEPVRPIVWVLDPSIPPQYREAVKRGILYWNKAYERIGYKNALVVQDAPTDKDWDHADGRYNTVRWTMSQSSAYAVAWFRPDPVTGQIMNAAVTVDANYPASAFTEFKEDVMGVGSDEARASAQAELNRRFRGEGWERRCCDHAHERAGRAAEDYARIAAANGDITPEQYVDKMIEDLIAHEVGHCLGLRHNFAASLQNSFAELINPAVVNARGIASSTMDYTPLNVAAVLAKVPLYYNAVPGPYDQWAIEYGYSDVAGQSTEQERPGLDMIARRAGAPGLMYLTDEDADGINPLAVRWDLGSDPLQYLNLMRQSNRQLLDYALSKSTGSGQSYTRRNALILRSLSAPIRMSRIALRMVGGMEFRRHFKGDVGETATLRPVSPERQRQAMEAIAQSVLRVEKIDLPQEVLYGMSGDPEAGGASFIAPLRQFIGSSQQQVLSQLMASDKLLAIAENEFKTRDRAAYTLTEHFDRTVGEITTEIGQDRAITPLRRDLQRALLARLMTLAGTRPVNGMEEARALAGQSLRSLNGRIGTQLNRPGLKDRTTRLHLRDLMETIQRFQARQMPTPDGN